MQIKTLRCDYAAPPEPSGKLVVVLHGRGDSPAGFHWMPPTMALEGVSWLLPCAPDPWFGGYSWYDMAPRQRPGVERSRGLLDRLFEELLEQGFRAEDTVLFGFSQGCLLTLEWGARSELPLAGCIGVSGYCFDPQSLAGELSAAARSRPWLITHGLEDEVLPHEVTASQVQSLQEAGLPLDFRSYSKTHTIGPDLEDLREALQTMLALQD